MGNMADKCFLCVRSVQKATSELNLIFHPSPFPAFHPFFTPPFLLSPHAVEANERAGAGEGLAARGPGSGGAGQRLVPGPDPQCHGETAAGWPELPLHGQFNGYL